MLKYITLTDTWKLLGMSPESIYKHFWWNKWSNDFLELIHGLLLTIPFVYYNYVNTILCFSLNKIFWAPIYVGVCFDWKPLLCTATYIHFLHILKSFEVDRKKIVYKCKRLPFSNQMISYVWHIITNRPCMWVGFIPAVTYSTFKKWVRELKAVLLFFQYDCRFWLGKCLYWHVGLQQYLTWHGQHANVCGSR